MIWILLILAIAANASASILIKISMLASNNKSQPLNVIELVSNWQLWLSVTLYVLTLALYALALTKLPLNVAHATLTSGAIVVVTFSSLLIFKEQFFWSTGFGLFFIILGIVILTIPNN